jgi:alpha-tubulin suppressor-like RCC1 family protein
MAKQSGVWNIQQVRDKQLQSLWDYDTTDYALYVWGGNSKGQLGLNQPNYTKYDSPVQLPGTWKSIATGGFVEKTMHAIKTDGTLWGWGKNDNGFLGVGNKTYHSSPVQIPGTTWAVVVKPRLYSTFATKTDGTLWAWGNNDKGELGQNNRTSYSSPKQIPGTTWPTSYGKLSASTGGCIAIKTDGSLWVWGRNDDKGKLGLNDKNNRSSPVQIPGSWSYLLNGTEENSNYAIRDDNTLWAWGSNNYGQLGQNNKTNRSSPVQIPGTTWNGLGGGNGVLFGTKTDGTIWGWGDGRGGQLGQNQQGPTIRYSSPVQIPGTTWSAGGQAKSHLGGAVGFTKTDGTLWMTGGSGDYGLVAIDGGNNVSRSSPVQIPGTDWKSGYGSISFNYMSGYALKKL